MYNLHVHSTYSHDGKSTVFEQCEKAIENNLQGIAITDHVDTGLYEQRNIYNNTKGSVLDTTKAKQMYKGKLNVLVGMEMGEECLHKDLAKEIRDIGGFDIILESRHFFEFLGSEYDFGYADIPLWSNNKMEYFVEGYFDTLLEISESLDFDVLAHLTLPLRYLNGMYNKNYDIHKNDKQIEKILKTLVKREKALELNTSGYNQFNLFMPDEYYLKMFNKLGGKYVTLGSDAHITSKLTNGLKEGKQLLKDCGFKYTYYYENRKPKIDEEL